MIGVILDFISIFKKNLRKKSQLPLYAYCGFNDENNRGEDFESNGNVIIDIITPTIQLFILVT